MHLACIKMASNSKRPLPSDASSSSVPASSSDAQSSKRARYYDDNDDDDFEFSEAMIDELDRAEQEELRDTKPRPPTPPPASKPPTVVGSSSSSSSTSRVTNAPRKDWARPPALPIDPNSDTVSFQQLDIDHYIGDPIPGMPGFQGGPVPILKMYGVTSEGNSVCAHLHGFLPYFYVPLPREGFGEEHCAAFRYVVLWAIQSYHDKDTL